MRYVRAAPKCMSRWDCHRNRTCSTTSPTIPEEGALFAGSMSDATGMVIDDVASAVDLGGVSVAVDVGGAHGAMVQAMVQASKGMKGIVLDRPGVVDGAIRQAAESGLADRFTGVAGDFFRQVPSADLYLLKMILHDWDDDACRTILRNCRASALVLRKSCSPMAMQS